MPAPLFTQTKPFGEDVVFRSSTTGEHDLDVYLESAERGGKTLAEMMAIVFTPEGNPNFTVGNTELLVQQAEDARDQAGVYAADALASKNAAAASEAAAAASAASLSSLQETIDTGVTSPIKSHMVSMFHASSF